MSSFTQKRSRMVERQLRRRGITDGRVLEAMEEVPRELFVPEPIRERAYEDAALPIGAGQTISQPWIVAAICAGLGLGGDETVLEIGGGSGYSAAVLVRLARRVISIELVPEVAQAALAALAEAGVGEEAVEVIVGDGSRGHPDGAPYEAIAVHAATPGRPRSLLDQLAPEGRLVAPVVDGHDELLTLYWSDSYDAERFLERVIAPCRFVPLLGEDGFSSE